MSRKCTECGRTIINDDPAITYYVCGSCMFPEQKKYPDCRCGHTWWSHVGSCLHCDSWWHCECQGYEPEEEIMARLPNTETHRFRFEIPSSNGKKLYKISQCIANKQRNV